MPNVIVKKVSKSYGKVHALNNVSLEVKDGEYITIVGPSGCGKTTLIKTIAGIVTPDTGDVVVDGVSVNTLSIEERNTGYVFQEIALFPHMTSYENVSYGLMVRGTSPQKRDGPVQEMFYMMGMAEYASLYPKEMSGGAKQKIAISRALISGSTFLLLDEPLGALDLKVRTLLRYELRKLVKDLHLTAIHVTHDQEEALSISDKIVIMRSGTVVEMGNPERLYLNPSTLFTAEFLGEANFLVGEISNIESGYAEVYVNEKVIKGILREGVSFSKGDRCVLAIRPEFVELSLKPDGENVLDGVVMSSSFVGDHFRYELKTPNGVELLSKSIVKEEALGFDVGEQVYATLPSDKLLTFSYPSEGLGKAISLE
jgi:ABC-type Fe3+/spermidine/putrescine transport system ATPase subunit